MSLLKKIIIINKKANPTLSFLPGSFTAGHVSKSAITPSGTTRFGRNLAGGRSRARRGSPGGGRRRRTRRRKWLVAPRLDPEMRLLQLLHLSGRLAILGSAETALWGELGVPGERENA